MARKKGEAKAEPEKKTVEDLNDEQLQALFFQHKNLIGAALAVKKKSDADFKNACKKAKAELGAGAVEDIKLAAELDTDEGAAKLRDRINRQLRVSRWMGADLGTQFDFGFEAAKPGTPTDRARAEGMDAAARGEPRKPPEKYAPGSPEYEFWMKGHEHQAISTTIGRGRPGTIGDRPSTHLQQ